MFSLNLNSKMSLLVSLLVVCLLSLMAFFTLAYFEAQFKKSISSQQFAMASSVAGQIDDKILTYQNELVQVARTISPELLAQRGEAQKFIENRFDTVSMFDSGLFVFSPDGRVLAGSVRGLTGMGERCPALNEIKKATKTHTPHISDPFFCFAHEHPIVMFTAPIHNAKGEVIAVLAGNLDLMKDNFLGKLASAKVGKSGYFYIFNENRTLLLHHDRSRMLTSVPVGLNKALEKAVRGFEGAEENVNSKGLLSVTSFKRLTATNWILAANYPLSEAYASMYEAKRTMLVALLAMVALIVLAVWAAMRHMMAPLLVLTGHVRAIAGNEEIPAPVHIHTHDEIEDLATAFNRLMEDVAGHKKVLQEEKEFEKSLVQHSSLPTFVIDANHRVLHWNKAAEVLTGIRASAILGTDDHWRGFYVSRHPTLADVVIDGASEEVDSIYRSCSKSADGLHAEGWYPHLNGKDRYISFYAAPIYDSTGELVAAIEIVEDMTERKRTEEELRKLSCAVEQSPNAVVITNTGGDIEYINPKFTVLTGYAREEVVGKNARILQSGETSPQYFRIMWETISSGLAWRGEFRNKKKNGELYWESALISPVKNENGAITHYVALKEDVTEQKLASEKMQQTLSLLNATLESTADGILVRDLAKKVLAFNGKFAEMWRLPESILATKDDKQMRTFVQDQLKDPEQFLEMTEKLYITPEMESDDILEFKDGRVFERVSKPQIIEDEIVGRVISFRDITERKKAEVELGKVNRALMTLSACNQALIYATDERSLLVEICQNIARNGGYRFAWVGYAMDDQAKSIRPVAQAGYDDGYLDSVQVTWADSETGRGPSGTAIRTGAPCSARDTTADACFAPWREEALKRGYLSSVALPLAADGKTFGALAIYSAEPEAFDASEMGLLQELASNLAYGITALRTREEHKRAEEALRQSAERYRSLVENIDLGITLVDSNYRILMSNSAAGNMFSKPVGEFLHKECFREFEKRAARCPHCPGAMAMETGKPAVVETEGIRDDGSRLAVKIRAFPVFDSAGKATGFIEVIQDITDQIQAEQEKKHLEDQLRQSQKFEAIGTLAGGIAHDFNNFLTVITAYCSLMERKTTEDDPLRNYLGKIFSATEKATSLTRSLLAYSRKQAIDPRSVDLKEIIQKVHNFLERLLGEDIDLTVHLADEHLTIMADSLQIEQVLMNLATNARDAMPRGGILQIAAERMEMGAEFVKAHGYGTPGGYALLIVSDTGKGIEEELQERIFEPFFTTKDVGKGTGLGLSMVYGIVKQHNGYVNFYSEPGKGSTFRIYLPITDSEENEIKQIDVRRPKGGNETILLVEDDKEIRASLKELLEQDGYTIIVAMDGEDGIEKFTDHREEVQLLLLDVIMPKKNGKEVYEEIRSMRPDMKAIFVSGYTADILTAKGVIQGDVNLITKPIAINTLSAKIREVLEK